MKIFTIENKNKNKKTKRCTSVDLLKLSTVTKNGAKKLMTSGKCTNNAALIKKIEFTWAAI